VSNSKRAARSRQEILDAAWNLIAVRGAEVSLADIAAEVGMTRQSIYVHFGSRGGLLVALVRRADEREDVFAKFDAALEAEDPLERLDRYVKAWLVFVPKIYPVASDLIRLRATDADAAAARAADYLWAACSVQAWGLLVKERGWSQGAASKTIRTAVARVLLG